MDTIILQTLGLGVLAHFIFPMLQPDKTGYIFYLGRKRYLLFAVIFCIAIASTVSSNNLCSNITSLLNREATYYDIIGVPHQSTKFTIKHKIRDIIQSLQEASIKTGLDNSSYRKTVENAAEILLSDARRKSYDVFGDYNFGDVESDDIFTLLLLSITTYILLFTISYCLSLSRRFEGAKTYMVIFILAALGMEIFTRFAGLQFFSTYMLPFQFIQALRALFPAVFFASLALSASFFNDEDLLKISMLETLLQTSAMIVPRLQTLSATLSIIDMKKRLHQAPVTDLMKDSLRATPPDAEEQKNQ